MVYAHEALISCSHWGLFCQETTIIIVDDIEQIQGLLNEWAMALMGIEPTSETKH